MKQIAFWSFIFGCISTIASPSLDEEFGCIPAKEAQSLIQDYNIDKGSFGPFELCKNTADIKKLFNDLQIIRNGQFEQQGSNSLIKGFVPQDQYYTWFRSQTRGIERGNDIPFATAYNRGGYFTVQDGWAILSTLGRVGTVIHEARHTQGYVHIPCTFGPYAQSSTPGCDREYDYAGSHAVEMEYYARVSVLGTNFHPVYKSMARLMAMARANFVFNKNPLKKRSALMVINEQKEAWLLADQRLHLRERLSQLPIKLKRTSFGASLFDGLGFFAIEPYQPTSQSHLISDDYSYFKLLKQDRGQGSVSELSDFEEIDIGQKRYFVYLNKAGLAASYLFAKGTWSKKIQLPQGAESQTKFINTLPDGTEGLFLYTRQKLYQLNPTTLASSELKTTYPSEYINFTMLAGELFALHQDGSLFYKSSTGLELHPGFINHKIHHMVSVPLYDSFEVQ